ncbi:hypothetical protein AB6A40_010261 [Gnathostoma spinigerum]|uniref:Uncharacterized protein n=1 Tax=Gnathostoma spinigerum TaxID=75299 RepID=A0ABD6F247_9BILA
MSSFDQSDFESCSFANNSVQYSPECATYTCDSPMAPLSCRSSMQQTAMLGIDSSPTQMVQSPSNSVIEPMMQPCLQQQSQQDYLFQNQPAPQQPPRPSHSEAQAPPAAMAQQYQHQRSLAMPQYPSKTINLQQSGSTRFPCPSQYPLPSHYASYQMSKQSSVSSPYQVPVACQQQQQQQQQQQRVYPPSRSAIAPPAALCTPQQYSQPANLSQFQMPLNPASSDHLSPYNGYERPANPLGTMVAGGNTQWSRRPASRSEMIRMELRHSVQARQQATSPINPSGMSTDGPLSEIRTDYTFYPSAVRFPGPTYQRMMSSQVMSMPSQSESATVLADPPVITSGSCTSNDIPDFCMPLDFPDEFDRSSSSNMSQTSAIPTELYDFKLGNGRVRVFFFFSSFGISV